MFAAHHRLSNLVLIIDNNDLQATSRTRDVLAVEPVARSFAPMMATLPTGPRPPRNFLMVCLLRSLPPK